MIWKKLTIESLSHALCDKDNIKITFNKAIKPKKAIAYLIDVYRSASGNPKINNGHPADTIFGSNNMGKLYGSYRFILADDSNRCSLFEMGVDDLKPRKEFWLKVYRASNSERDLMVKELSGLVAA